MMPLERLQRTLAAGIVTGTAEAADFIAAPDAISPMRRLGIYRNHYLVTLSAALGSSFPTVQALVGAAFFAQAARRFVAAVPPTGPCLHEYGGLFPGFLAQLGEASELPYLADVARLDWALNLAYHAPDERRLPLEALASTTPDRLAGLRFIVHPSIQVLESPYPLTAIWRAAQPGGAADEPVDLDQGGETLLVMRDGDDVVFQRIDVALQVFLDALMHRRTVAAAARAARAARATFDLAAALQMLLDLDAFIDRDPNPAVIQGAQT